MQQRGTFQMRFRHLYSPYRRIYLYDTGFSAVIKRVKFR